MPRLSSTRTAASSSTVSSRPLTRRRSPRARQRSRRFVLDARELADLELIATGAASPLTGFLDSRRLPVRARSSSPGGRHGLAAAVHAGGADETTRRSSPATSARSPTAAAGCGAPSRSTDVFTRDPLVESRAVYGTEDAAHPGVAYLLARPRTLVGGSVQVLPLGDDRPFLDYRLTPRELRARISRARLEAASPGSRRATRFTARTSTSRSSRSK